MVWDSQQHVFYFGGAGEIDHVLWDAPSNTVFHDNWTQQFGPDATPEGSRAATMAWPTEQPNQQLIFYKGRDYAIHRIFWDAPSNTLSHMDWSQRSGAPPATGFSPTAMVWANQLPSATRQPWCGTSRYREKGSPAGLDDNPRVRGPDL
jgi:hypothetical protein